MLTHSSAQSGAEASAATGLRTDPVLIVGTARSGTNLVTRILDMHSRIRVPYPLHLMDVLSGLETSYGDLGADRRMMSLIRDARLLAARHTVPWRAIPSADRVLGALPQRSVFGVMAAMWELDTRDAGKQRWCDRSIGMIDHVDAVRSVYPDAQLIWLVRDPRDVAASARDAVFLPGHPELIARMWQRHQERGLALTRTLPAGSVHRLRYEDLVVDPTAAVKDLCAFLDEDYEPRMLEYFQDAEAQRLAGLSEAWTNLREPVLATNSGKHVDRLTPGGIATVETICATGMRDLGYEPSRPARPAPTRLDTRSHRMSVVAGNALLRLRVEARSVRKDKSHWARWRRALTVFWVTQRQRARRIVRSRSGALR